MIYLDTGCLVKLYYPEPESAQIVAHVQGKIICYTPLHALEFANALQLKAFFGTATAAQVAAARALVKLDVDTGVLSSIQLEWTRVFQQAVALAEQHTSLLGCRSLDILH
ncbi:MAG: PIN domain protein, partial [Tepidisphaerales bacterium]